MTLVEPAHLQLGDQIAIGADCACIRAIEGPDTAGAFDIYLDNNSHKVVSEPVVLIA